MFTRSSLRTLHPPWVLSGVFILVLAGCTQSVTSHHRASNLGQALLNPLGEAAIRIDATKSYGSLSENTLGGMFGASNSVLFRPGYAQTLKGLKLKILRVHGDSYLKDGFTAGIGRLDQRAIVNPATTVLTLRHPPGPDEWAKVAKTVGAKLIITMPFGDGSEPYKNQFVNLVEYMNGMVTPEVETRALSEGWTPKRWSAYDLASPGYFAWLRREMNKELNVIPDPGPYAVPFWELGNEVYGGWYTHAVPIALYSQKVIEIGNAMKAMDPTIKVGAVITADKGSSVWDAHTLGNPVWDDVLLRTTAENALTSRAGGKLPAIDFLIPHLYGPWPNAFKEFVLFNPKRQSYSDTTSVPIAHVRAVTIPPGTYTVSIHVRGVAAPNAAGQMEYPKIGLRLIDDQGQGNIDVPSVTIPPPATSSVFDAGWMEVSATAEVRNFPQKIRLKAAPQKYRMELLFSNHAWQRGISQPLFFARTELQLGKSSDLIAQSFVSIDSVIQPVRFIFGRSGMALPASAKLVADIVPDNGNQPDLSAPALARLNTVPWFSASNVSENTGTEIILTPEGPLTPMIPGAKYWIVVHLTENLSSGTLFAYGSSYENYSAGQLLEKTSSTTWHNDARISDLYFVAHDDLQRVVKAKDIIFTDESGKQLTVALSKQEWFEGTSLAAYATEAGVQGVHDTIRDLNLQLKTDHPQWQTLPDYKPDIIATEFGFLGPWSSEDNGRTSYRQMHTAVYVANAYISMFNPQEHGSTPIEGVTQWCLDGLDQIFSYQGNSMGIFLVNNTNNNSPQADDPNLYLYTPRYHVTKLLNESRGSLLVETKTQSFMHDYLLNFASVMIPQDPGGSGAACDTKKYFWTCWPGIMKAPLFQRKYINAYSSLDPVQKKLFINIVNSHAELPFRIRINLSGFTANTPAMIRTVEANDGRGMEAINGFSTLLIAAVGAGDPTDRVRVADASAFRAGDLIAVESMSHGFSEFFRVGSIQKESGTLFLKNLKDENTGNVQACYKSDYVNGCTLYKSTEVTRVTGNVGITQSTIANPGNEFTVILPAASVSAIELK